MIMTINIAPEIQMYTQQIVKNTIGTQAQVKGFEWSAGGLFNKVFKINTTNGDFVLKVECDKIFYATRKDQIENEVLGNALFQKAGIPCANILAYDYTKKDVGVRYVFMEWIKNDMNDCPIGGLEHFDEPTKSEIERQEKTIAEKEQGITNSHFGSLSQSGTLGWHETYDGYYHSTLNLLIKDSEKYGVFTDEELDIVKEASEKPLVYSKKYIPTFNHGDMGYHNMIWGKNKIYVYDFGNANYWLPYAREVHGREKGVDIIDVMGLDRNLYENCLIGAFEKMFWRESERLTEDYAYIRDWMKPGIEAAKKDTSRTHITDFANSCRRIL